MIDEIKQRDKGLAEVLVERFERWILPRALDIKEKVGRGEKLNDFDIIFLENELKEAKAIKSIVDRSTQYQSLYARAISLYWEITKKGLEIEQNESESDAASHST